MAFNGAPPDLERNVQGQIAMFRNRCAAVRQVVPEHMLTDLLSHPPWLAIQASSGLGGENMSNPVGFLRARRNHLQSGQPLQTSAAGDAGSIERAAMPTQN